MEKDGLYFRAFVENKKMNKLQLARDLGMSQPNLYGLFKSKKFEPETIKNLEKVLKVKWTDVLKTDISTNISREIKGSVIPDSQFIKSTIDRMLTDREKALAVIEEMAAYLIKTGYNIGNKHATEDLDEEKNKTGSKAGLTNH